MVIRIPHKQSSGISNFLKHHKYSSSKGTRMTRELLHPSIKTASPREAVNPKDSGMLADAMEIYVDIN